MSSKNIPLPLSPESKLFLAVLEQENSEIGEAGVFWLRNLGGEPDIGTLYIDTNPNEFNKPVRYLYQQTGKAVLKRGTPPQAVYEAHFDPIEVPTPRTFFEIIEKMNEGQFLKLGPNDKGVCIVPRHRRSEVLQFLGLSVSW